MVKPEWGTKRACPKCGTRFYDLGKDYPVTCINCGVHWDPDPILKSKQPLPFDAPKPEKEKKVAGEDDDDTDLNEDLDLADEEEAPVDDDNDLGGDDDLGVPTRDEDEEH